MSDFRQIIKLSAWENLKILPEKSFNRVITEAEILENPDKRIKSEEKCVHNCYKSAKEG